MSLEEFGTGVDQTLTRLRRAFGSKKGFSYEWRVGQLAALKKLVVENDTAISKAMWTDLHKSPFECTVTEQGVVLSEVDHALAHLSKWMRPERVSTPLIDQPGNCEIRHDPLGVTLIIGAWNYPINLLLGPLVGAISGGNACILKPSELAPATAQLIADLVPRYLDRDFFAVVQAGPQETDALLDRAFDLIFFTGSTNVGKIVMTKAAVHLTPVTLELGGKSPAIVLADADLKVTARRLAWGKFMNAGQTCVAPDYILVESSFEDRLVNELKIAIEEMYGSDPKKSSDYCRIVNQRNFDRLTRFLNDGQTVCGGTTDGTERYIAPTVLKNVDPSSKVMSEEIFGPILPVLSIGSLDEAISFINARPKPLALYLFSSSSSAREKVVDSTTAGGVCVNECVMHMPIPGLPFGGVGASGMGHYHGKFSFDTFTHAKGILSKSTWIDVPIRYAPYTDDKLKWIQRLM